MSELEDRMLEYRSKPETKLDKTLPLLAMIDGHSFSKLIKNNYKKPFDPEFIELMNKTAEYLVARIPCCRFAYTQSDEINLFMDSRNEIGNPWFEYRMSKLLSIIPSMATSIFGKLRYQKNPDSDLCEFDCKVWNVPTDNDVFAWFLYRQIDCMRNSKQQAAQTYFKHQELDNLNTDEAIQKLLELRGIDWNDYEPGMKYGRFVWRREVEYSNERGPYTRGLYKAVPAWELTTTEGRTKFMNLLGLQENDEN